MPLIQSDEYKTTNGNRIKLCVYVNTSNLQDIRIKIDNLIVKTKGARTSFKVVDFGRHDSRKTYEQEYKELLQACLKYCTIDEIKLMLDNTCKAYIGSVVLAAIQACEKVVDILEE